MTTDLTDIPAALQSVLPDLRRIPLGKMPPAIVDETADRLLPGPGPEARAVPVAAFNSSI